MDFLIFAVAVACSIFAWRFVFHQFTGAGRSKALSHFLALSTSSFVFVALMVGWIVTSQPESGSALPTPGTADTNPKIKGLGLTVNEFIDEYKRLSQGFELAGKFESIKYDRGADDKTAMSVSVFLSGGITLHITADKSSNIITDIIIGDSPDRVPDILKIITAVVFATTPSTPDTERGNILSAIGINSVGDDIKSAAHGNILYEFKNNKKIGGALLVISSIDSGEDTKKTKIPADVLFTIIKDESKRDIKRTVEVRLNKKVSKEVLSEIALSIKQNETHPHERTFIVYFIEGGDDKQGYWATTHFNPNLEVKIIGLSSDDEKKLTASPDQKPGRKVIASWLDDRPGSETKVTLFSAKEALFLEFTDRYGGTRVKEINIRSDKGTEVISDKDGNEFGEYFIINTNNELEFWSANGNYYTAKKIPDSAQPL